MREGPAEMRARALEGLKILQEFRTRGPLSQGDTEASVAIVQTAAMLYIGDMLRELLPEPEAPPYGGNDYEVIVSPYNDETRIFMRLATGKKYLTVADARQLAETLLDAADAIEEDRP